MGWLCLPILVVEYDRSRSYSRSYSRGQYDLERRDDWSSRPWCREEQEDLPDLLLLLSESEGSGEPSDGSPGSQRFLFEQAFRLLIRLDLVEVEPSSSELYPGPGELSDPSFNGGPSPSPGSGSWDRPFIGR